MALVSSKTLSLKAIVIWLAAVCAFGQALVTLGLSLNDHTLCLVGRFFIGLSDA